MNISSKEHSLPQRGIVVAETDALRLRGLLATHRDAATRDATHLCDLALELERALQLPREAVPADVVVMDSRVEVLDLANGERGAYTLSYPADSDPASGRISVLAPLGTAMLGYREGDEVEWLMPGGVRRLRIEKVRRHDEHTCSH
jgi:regulator of nucleoside diphosphate kinase